MSTRSPPDLSMQNVPLSPVVADDADQKLPEQELLPVDYSSDMEGLAKETGQDEDSGKNRGSDEPSPIADTKHVSTRSLIIEATVVPLLILVPQIIIKLAFVYEEYSFVQVKGPEGLNAFREFERWSIFFALSYASFVFSEILFRFLPTLTLLFFELTGKRVSRSGRTAILCLSFAAKYLGLATALIAIYYLALSMLIVSSFDLAERQLFSMLNVKEQNLAKELVFGEKAESLLAVVAVLLLFMAVEKYFIAAIHASFHRVALAPRVALCNEKFRVVSILYRARQATRSTLSTATLSTLGGVEEDEDPEVSPSTARGIDLISIARAKFVANSIFRTLCPADREYITSSDLRPYFPLGEHEKAFKVFDINHKGNLDKEDFKLAVVSIYDERYRTATALIANSRIIRKLDYTLFSLFSFFGFLFALVIYNHNGYIWVTSVGSFILGFSFLFQTTVARIFDAFLYVFVEHAYDVTDDVLVDNERLSVKEVQIFTTIFLKLDGTIVYSPNPALKGKTIYNKQRARTEIDTIVILVDAATGIEKIAQIRSKLTSYLTETANEFTGTVAVNIIRFVGEGAQRQANVKIEAKHRPKDEDLRSDIALRERRSSLLGYFNSICKDLELKMTIENADN